MRPDVLYLRDIIEAAEAIGRFIAGMGREKFVKDELRQAGVLQKLIVIGEAAAHLSKEFRALHPEIEWADIVGFRNIAVHEYFGVSWRIVWVTATNDVPDLHARISRILSEEYADDL
ncbi:MAG: DUF86 domain-containing protein [Anaerolineae bacterium]|nr:DUF86 domain-containing protein [Anaerolineae bacterium]